MCRHTEARQSLQDARKIAAYAERLGAKFVPNSPRPTSDHLGAVFADTVLQAGVRYNTVVRPRVERILRDFPESSNLDGLCMLLETSGASHFLGWDHRTKVSRFERLVQFFRSRDLNSSVDVSKFLGTASARPQLLEINGVGPKTFDYLCALLGLDRIAVDRHVVTFVAEAGVSSGGYDYTQRVASFAADLLGLMRRDFDTWMWRHVSSRSEKPLQLALEL